MNMSFNTLLIKSQSPHLQVHLNRPDKRNALNPEMILELTEVLNNAKIRKDIKTLTISGEGAAFCSGADLEYLKSMQKYDRTKNREDSLQLANLYRGLYMFPKPVIAAVNGPAIAGGCGLASACDIIIASGSAKFGYPEVKIGFVASMVSLFLIRQIGERKARELLLSGIIISAEEAFSIGLINRIVPGPEEELQKEVNKMQNEFVQNSSEAMKKTKELFNSFYYNPITEMISQYAEINVEARESQDFYEGISAFLDKRKPNWQ